ncbi:MAG: alpha/beta hydrolase [Hyphomicrobiaceae bacterium]|nr:alpha/beta hydrolase [Hyphomicrobiaceae bacterium]
MSTPSITSTSKTPAEIVAELDAKAEIHHTPCGAGHMVWRRWGSGQPLVLFHGGSGSWNHWIRTIPVMAERYAVWVPDLPGLGQSAMPNEPYVPESCADAVTLGVRELIPAHTRFHLAGFSFGGQIASLVAAMLGDQLSDLTLIGVAALGLPMGPREPMGRQKSSMSLEEIHAVHRRNLAILMLAHADRIDDLAVHLQTENIRQARFRSKPFATTDTIRRKLAEIKVPLKTIWGALDVVAYPSLQTRLDILAEHHPEMQARIIADAGHWVMYEAADAFNAALIELIGTPA